MERIVERLDRLVWIDLEMTGLDPGRDVIVEIAVVVTDEQLVVLDEGLDLVVHQPDEALALMDAFVTKMHGKSGLTEEIRAATLSLADAGAQTLAYIAGHIPDVRSVPLCGNSIGVDRSFLAAYLPEIDKYLHYRNIDVSSVKELAKRWHPDLYAKRPKKVEGHRALADILESIEELKYYRSAVFR